MPVLIIPFIVVGLFAKVANKNYTKKQLALPVRSNNEPKLQDLIDTIANNLNIVEKDFYAELYSETREKIKV